MSFSPERAREARAKQTAMRNTVTTRMRQVQRLSNRREARTSPIAGAPSLASISGHTPHERFLREQVSLQENSRSGDRKGRRYKFFESTMKFAMGLALLSLNAYGFAKDFLHLPTRKTIFKHIARLTFTSIEKIP
jgi:hypothetical protein